MKHLQVETTSVCNARCVFCPHDNLISGHMDKDLYEKIVINAGQYNLETFSPLMNGEPFCDPEIMERISFARKILKPETVIRIFTNGSLLTEAIIDELAAMKNIEVTVSLNGACKETRQKLMGLDDFDKVVISIGQMKQKGMRVQTSFVWFPTVSMAEVKAFASFPNPLMIRFQSFAGYIYDYQRLHGSCSRLATYLTVLHNGNVTLCCFDVFGAVTFGNLREQTIAEVLKNSERAKYLKANQEGKINQLKLCRQCTEGD